MVSQQEPVVTGDAVVLDVQIAQLPVRALSAIIDVTVVFIVYIIGVVLWAATLTQFDPALSAAVLIVFTVLAIVGYPTIFETATGAVRWARSRWDCGWCPTTAARNAFVRRCFVRWPA